MKTILILLFISLLYLVFCVKRAANRFFPEYYLNLYRLESSKPKVICIGTSKVENGFDYEAPLPNGRQFIRISAPALMVGSLTRTLGFIIEKDYTNIEEVIIDSSCLTLESDIYIKAQLRYRPDLLPLKKQLKWFFKKQRLKQGKKQNLNYGHERSIKTSTLSRKRVDTFMRKNYSGVRVRKLDELTSLTSTINNLKARGISVTLMHTTHSQYANEWFGEMKNEMLNLVSDFVELAQCQVLDVTHMIQPELYRDCTHFNNKGREQLQLELYKYLETRYY